MDYEQPHKLITKLTRKFLYAHMLALPSLVSDANEQNFLFFFLNFYAITSTARVQLEHRGREIEAGLDAIKVL